MNYVSIFRRQSGNTVLMSKEYLPTVPTTKSNGELHLNRRSNEQVLLSKSLRELLDDYYGDEPSALASLLSQEQFAWGPSEAGIHAGGSGSYPWG